jgi:NAD(P)-dependent dehydrogenase (short-subunit alcohol dehydrogenase family)
VPPPRDHNGPSSHRVVWVTGASGGIGRALCLRLAGEGARVAASARPSAALSSLTDGDPSGRIAAFPLDVRDEAATRSTVDAVERVLGPVDLAVLNAGAHIPMSARNFSESTARDLMTVNYLGVVHGMAALLPRLIERRGGHIAVVSSLAGYRGLPTAAAYGPTKAALINLCEALAPELADANIRLQLISPGFVRTPLTDRNTFPMPFLMDVERAVDVICAGLESARFEIAFPRRLAWVLKLARLLPAKAYFAAVRRATGA